MYPDKHILLGIIFSIVILLIFPELGFFPVLIILFSSVLIDIDHYFYYIFKEKNFSLLKAYRWFIQTQNWPSNKKIKRIVVLHTLEVLIILGVFSFFNFYILLIFTGFLFHSSIDIIDMIVNNEIDTREFSLIRYLNRKNKNK